MTDKQWIEMLIKDIEKEKDLLSSFPEKKQKAINRIMKSYNDDYVKADFDPDEYNEEITERIDDFIAWTETL